MRNQQSNNFSASDKSPSLPRVGLKEFGLILVILALTFASFLPTLQNQFTNWDDPAFILQNPSVITLDWPHIVDSFKTVYVNVYCPLTILSWAIEHHFFGFDPFVFHLNNLLLHMWVTACVFVFGLRLGLPVVAAGLAALLYGVHPIHVESISWATERKDVLFASFYVPALIAYWSYLKTGRKLSYVLAFILGVLSMLSKATALSMPIALLTLDWMAQRKFNKWMILDKIPFFAYIIPLTLITLVHHTDIEEPLPGEDINKAIPIFFWSFAYYIRTFIWPFDIFPYCQLPLPITWANWSYVWSLIIFVTYGLLLWIYRRNRWFVFGFLFFMATIFFFLRVGVIVRYTCIVSDRHIYVPSIGLCLFFGYWFYRWFQNTSKRSIKAFAALIVTVIYISFAVKTFFLTQIWKDSITFWTYTIEKNPQLVGKAYALRAFAYFEMEQWDLALQDADKTLQANPSSDGAFNIRGMIYSQRGKEELALHEFNQAIKYKPSEDATYINRANVYAAMGKFDEAIADAEKSIELRPSAKAYGIRGKLYGLKGELERALADLDRSLYLYPNDPLIYYDRGFFQSQLGDHEAALADFNKALSLKPDDFFTLDQRGAVYHVMGEYAKAQQDFDKVVKLDPSYARGFNNRGSNHLAQGNLERALDDFDKAIALEPEYATAYMNRSLAFQHRQQWKEAMADAVKAQSLGYPLKDEEIEQLRQKVSEVPVE